MVLPVRGRGAARSPLGQGCRGEGWSRPSDPASAWGLPQGDRWVKKGWVGPRSPAGALPEGMARPEDGD